MAEKIQVWEAHCTCVFAMIDKSGPNLAFRVLLHPVYSVHQYTMQRYMLTTLSTVESSRCERLCNDGVGSVTCCFFLHFMFDYDED